MRITIGKKLTIGFGSVLALLFGVILFCAATYFKTIQAYQEFTNSRAQQANLAGDLSVEFKKEVQAWKDILLRGDDPAKFAKYKEELDHEDEIVRQKTEDLKNGPYRLLTEGAQRDLMEFEKEYQKLKDGYHAALKVYTGGAGGNYKEADALVVGMDRPPTQLLLGLSSRLIETTNRMAKDKAARSYRLGIAIGLAGLAAFIFGMLFTFFIIRSITLPLKSLTAAAAILAQADLTHEITVRSNDEIGDLADNFRNMVKELRSILLKVQEATGQITASGTEILAASQEQASAAREQSSAVAETTSAAKELSTTSESVGESIKKVAQVAAHALAGMAKIKETIDRTNGMLNSLGEKSQKIGKITELIDDVADQTNLLAVNASIEAARAGEQGRGFMAVADEIRKLADSSAKSTKDITALIELIQHEMSNTIMSMEQNIQSVDEEARLAQQTTEKTKEIAMSTHQQISGAKQIADAMMNIDETMKQVAAGAQQSQIAVKQLTELAGDLKQAASKFKL